MNMLYWPESSRRSFWSGLLTLLSFVGACCCGSPPAVAADHVIGRKIADFFLPEATTGNVVALSDFRDARVRVVVFLGTECQIGNAYLPDLMDFQKR